MDYPEFETEFNALYDLMPEDVNKKVLRDLVDDGVAAKAELTKALGLGPDQRKVVKIGSSDYLQQSHLFQLMRRFLENNDLIDEDDAAESSGGEYRVLTMFMDNAIQPKGKKQSMKLTKHMARVITDHLKENWTKYVNSHNQSLFTPTKLDEKFKNWDTAVSNLFEGLSASRCEVVITTNPLDMLLASQEADFDSCFSFDGCHANAPSAKVRDDFTAFIFIRSDEVPEYPFYKKARSWLYVVDDYSKFLIANFYGSIADTQVRAISQEVSSSLSAHLETENVWVAKMGKRGHMTKTALYYPRRKIVNAGYRGCDDYDHDDPTFKTFEHQKHSVWFDRNVMRFAMLKSKLPEGEDLADHLPTLTFKNGTCLACGAVTPHNDELKCNECADGEEYDCCECDYSSRNEDNLTCVNGNRYCSCCLDQYTFYCDSCEYHHRGSASHHDWDGEPICNSCFRNHYTECRECAVAVRDADIVTIDGYGSYCSGCVDTEFTACSECDSYVSNEDIEQGMCSCCLNKVMPECNDCNERLPVAELTDGVCKACSSVDEADDEDDDSPASTSPSTSSGLEDFIREAEIAAAAKAEIAAVAKATALAELQTTQLHVVFDLGVISSRAVAADPGVSPL